MTTEPETISDLRRRLESERSAIIGEIALGDYLAPGFLQILANTQAAIQAVDAAQVEHAEPAPARVVVRDVDGEPLALGIFGQDDAASAVEVSPLRALAVAASLTTAALRRLSSID